MKTFVRISGSREIKLQSIRVARTLALFTIFDYNDALEKVAGALYTR